MYLARNHYGAEKDALARPLLERDLQMGFSAIDVNEGDEESWKSDFSSGKDVGYKGSEFGLFRVARSSAASTR